MPAVTPGIRVASVSRRLVLILLGLAAVAWVVVDARMAGMQSEPWMDPGPLGFYLGVWVAMMAAMMLPSMVPMAGVYDRLRTAHRARGGGARLDWPGTGHVAAGVVILAAAAYQVTPLKDACLRRCTATLTFLMTRWQDGRAGALRLGAVHGTWCLGCCWAPMAVLFAVGAVSLGWMAFVAALIAGEKLVPAGRLPRLAVAGCCWCWASPCSRHRMPSRVSQSTTGIPGPR